MLSTPALSGEWEVPVTRNEDHPSKRGGWGGGVGGASLRDHLWQGPPLPVTLRLIHPPPKMTQGVMTPPNGDLPLATQRRVESIASDRSPFAVARPHLSAWSVVSYFLRYFSSTSTEPFTSFYPVGFAIFATHAVIAQPSALSKRAQTRTRTLPVEDRVRGGAPVRIRAPTESHRIVNSKSPREGR